MTICVLVTAPPRPRRGNRVTALRWAHLLRQLGHRVRVTARVPDGALDLVIALHAGHSAAALEALRRARPDVPIVLALTGTDLYEPSSPAALQRSLELADRLVVLQPLALERLPLSLRARARTIIQSASPAKPRRWVVDRDLQVCVIGHLREVKDPLRTAHAARRLGAGSRVHVLHLGAALSDEMEQAARAEAAQNPRYTWLGERPRRETLELLAGSDLLVVSSRSEGGANAISEALAAGVPVLSSRIDGSIGVLGPDYPGYFPYQDTEALAALLERFEADETFRASLRARCEALAPGLRPARELSAWAELIEELVPSSERLAMGEDVRTGLSARPRRLSCRYFYDRAGSLLFEEICATPEYYLTRAEREILETHASDIAARMPAAEVWELGSGSSVKTRLLLEALQSRLAPGTRPLRYVPVDVSRSMLAESTRALRERWPALEVSPIAGEYAVGIERLGLAGTGARVILWLGSNIGNFERDAATELLARIGGKMRPSDRLLVGVDLRKDRRILEAAYDDAGGVTARFNKNILARINRELGGHFDLEAFEHRAVYDEAAGRIDLYLVSTRAQRVSIDRLGLDLTFAPGEAIHTESSFKYGGEEIRTLADRAGLVLLEQWTDQQGRFALCAFRRA